MVTNFCSVGSKFHLCKMWNEPNQPTWKWRLQHKGNANLTGNKALVTSLVIVNVVITSVSILERRWGTLFPYSCSLRDDLTHGLSAPKRIKKDTSAAQRPLRVSRCAGKQQKAKSHINKWVVVVNILLFVIQDQRTDPAEWWGAFLKETSTLWNLQSPDPSSIKRPSSSKGSPSGCEAALPDFFWLLLLSSRSSRPLQMWRRWHLTLHCYFNAFLHWNCTWFYDNCTYKVIIKQWMSYEWPVI